MADTVQTKELDPSRYQASFQAIALAGSSKAESMSAVDAASDGRFSEAQASLMQADAYLAQAHKTQSEMIEDEIRGVPTEVDVMLIHAQDHLAMAQSARDTAAVVVGLYQRLFELRHELAA